MNFFFLFFCISYIFYFLFIFYKFYFQFFSYKNDKEILETDDRIQIIREKDYLGFYELVIAEVQPEDAGVYSCKAVNKFGEASCEAKATTVGT